MFNSAKSLWITSFLLDILSLFACAAGFVIKEEYLDVAIIAICCPCKLGLLFFFDTIINGHKNINVDFYTHLSMITILSNVLLLWYTAISILSGVLTYHEVIIPIIIMIIFEVLAVYLVFRCIIVWGKNDEK